MKKSEDCPKKTENETTENKQTSKLPKGKAQNVSKAKERGKGAKNNIKKVRKRLLCWQSKSTLVFGKAS